MEKERAAFCLPTLLIGKNSDLFWDCRGAKPCFVVEGKFGSNVTFYFLLFLLLLFIEGWWSRYIFDLIYEWDCGFLDFTLQLTSRWT